MNSISNPIPFKHYYREIWPKKMIIGHHTEGDPSGKGSVEWWKMRNNGAGTVCTPYIIQDDGDVLVLYDDKFWSFALGIGSKGQARRIEQGAVNIELASWGAIEKIGERFIDNYSRSRIIPPDQVIQYPTVWRLGFEYFQRYTPAAIQTFCELVKDISTRHEIPVVFNRFNFFGYQNPDVKAGKPGLYSHAAFRMDKADMHPQPDLIEALEKAFPG